MKRIGVAAVAAFCMSDCLDPTSIEIVVSTDVPCSFVNSTAIAVGPPGNDSTGIAAKTASCSDDGGIGTLVLTPSGGIDTAVGIRVTLGVGATQADQCGPDFAGCIVARRSLGYIAHTPLTLPITMQQSCLGQPCDQFSTCVTGQCVDAGIPSCDETGTCTIDAGTPPIDAGPCADIAPKLVAPVTAAVTPHIVVTSSGYAIAYETTSASDPLRTYLVVALDKNGTSGQVGELASALATSTSVGPLGTDGTNFASTFQVQASTYTAREVNLVSTTLAEASSAAPVKLPRAGMHFDPGGSAYAFFFIDDADSPTFAYWRPGSALATTSVALSGASDPALSYFNGKYHGTVHDASSCYVVTGALSFISLTAVLDAPWPLCTTLRFAENAPSVDMVVTREANGANPTTFRMLARTAISATSTAQIIDNVDDQAFVVLPGVGNAFHIVYGTSQTIRETTIDTTLAFTKPKTIAPATFQITPASIGFDAVAEPGTMAHDIAFWAPTPTPGIYFTRICN